MSSFSSGPSSPLSRSPPSRSDSVQRSSPVLPRSPRASSGYQSSRHTTSDTKNGAKVRQVDWEEGPGLSPLRTTRNDIVHVSRNKVRSYSPIDSGSPSSSSCNEALKYPVRTLDLTTHHAPARSQAHQRQLSLPYQPAFPNRRFSSCQQAFQEPQEASPVSPIFLLLPSPFPPVPASPHRRPCTPERRTPTGHITPQTSLSSFDTTSHASTSTSTSKHCIPRVGFATSSASPRSVKVNSNSSTPSRRPTSSVLIRQALVPARGPPTLAMSMQIHAPSPVLSSGRPLSPPTYTHPHSRIGSRAPSPFNAPPPLRPTMTRPPSRSERLLRDTLRKAEEHDRIMALAALPSPSLFGASQPAHGFMVPPPPGGRRIRRNTSSSTKTDPALDSFAYCDTGECSLSEDEEYEDMSGSGRRYLFRSPSTSSSSSGNGNAVPFAQSRAAPPLPRLYSDDHETRHHQSWRDIDAYGSPVSPTRNPLHRSARSASVVARSSQDVERPPVAPHEVVLRSRLEGVLKSAQSQNDRRRSRERDCSGGSGSANSFASSRNMSGEGEWFFAPSEQQALVGSPSPVSHLNGMDSPSTRSRANTTTSQPSHRRSSSVSTQPMRSPQLASRTLPTHHKVPTPPGVTPLTPPPTPPFNARSAAAQCRQMDGYVSFANIEGLGVPGGEDDYEDGDEEAKGRAKWLKWLSIGQHKAAGRDRSDTTISR